MTNLSYQFPKVRNVCSLKVCYYKSPSLPFYSLLYKTKKKDSRDQIYRTKKWFPTISRVSDARNRKLVYENFSNLQA